MLRKQLPQKKEAERLADKAKIDEAYDMADNMRDEYVKKYGVYYVRTKNRILDEAWPTVSDVLKIFMD